MSTENTQPTAPAPDGIDAAFAEAGITDADFQDAQPAPIEEAAPEAEAAEAETQPEGRERDEHGRFKAKESNEAEAGETEQKAEATPEAEQQADDAPQGLSEAAKAAWKDVPAPVKADIQRRYSEMERGLQSYQQNFGDLKDYVQLAQQNGTTIKAALDNYVGIEKMLAENPKEALTRIAKNVGVDPAQLFGQQPQGEQAQRDANTINELRQELAELRRGFTGFTQNYQQQQQAAKQQQATQTVEQFAASHPRFDELAGDIAQMLQTGYAASLEDAYAKAERLNPAPQPAPQPAAQTRKPSANLSVAGAPGSGSNPTTRKPPTSLDAHLEEIFREVGIS